MSFSEAQPNLPDSGAAGPQTPFSIVGENPTTQPRRFFQILLDFADRKRWLFLGLILVVYLLSFNGKWRVEADSALYLSLARNLAMGRGYTYHGVRHEMVYPGLPYALAGLARVFPHHFIVAGDVLILLCSLATLALIYRLVWLAYDRPTAILIVFGVAFTGEFVRYSLQILTDIPFLTGVMAVLAGHEAIFGGRLDGRGRGKWWDWVLLIAGLALAIVTRPTMIGLLAAWIIALGVMAISRRAWRPVAVAGIFCLAAVALFLWLDPRRVPGHGLAGSYERIAIDKLTTDLPHEFTSIVRSNLVDLLTISVPRAVFGGDLLFPWMNAIFAAVVLLAGIALARKRLLWGLWVAITVLALVLLLSQYRYVLEILPLLVLGWWNLLRKINVSLPRRWGNGAFALLLFVGMFINFGRVVVFVVQQHRHPFLANYRDGQFEPYAKMANDVRAATTRSDVIFCPDKFARVMTFLADRNCCEPIEPEPAAPGHLLVIVDSTETDYCSWLGDHHVPLTGDLVSTVPRRRGKPPLRLVRCSVGFPAN